MTEQAADAAVDQAGRSLRLPTIRSHFTEIADAAEREQRALRWKRIRMGKRTPA